MVKQMVCMKGIAPLCRPPVKLGAYVAAQYRLQRNAARGGAHTAFTAVS